MLMPAAASFAFESALYRGRLLPGLAVLEEPGDGDGMAKTGAGLASPDASAEQAAAKFMHRGRRHQGGPFEKGPAAPHRELPAG
jgi:hypothetical protein